MSRNATNAVQDKTVFATGLPLRYLEGAIQDVHSLTQNPTLLASRQSEALRVLDQILVVDLQKSQKTCTREDKGNQPPPSSTCITFTVMCKGTLSTCL